MQIFAIRHTRVNLASGICYGQTDVPLAESFEQEIKDVSNRLSAVLDMTKQVRIFSSPLQRCQQLALNLGKNIQLNDQLKELNFGLWEMKRWDDADASMLHWMENYQTVCCPQGESWPDLVHRVRQFIQLSLMPKRPSESNETVVLVTHAGVIRALQHILLDMTVEQVFSQTIDYGSVTKFKLDDLSI